ncbi:uncharacterized protein LOC131304664 [Rhododendron vialii]|uniref:uncharacterized protein LOC131304664 n=1 Tax=Rhododendron vialii TaxID=182163 RepID=UPI00265F3709|nr:uncharacterized protein LOC131304664 [Rhododendron vialii]
MLWRINFQHHTRISRVPNRVERQWRFLILSLLFTSPTSTHHSPPFLLLLDSLFSLFIPASFLTYPKTSGRLSLSSFKLSASAAEKKKLPIVSTNGGDFRVACRLWRAWSCKRNESRKSMLTTLHGYHHPVALLSASNILEPESTW